MANKPIILTDNILDNVVLHSTYLLGNSVNDDVAGRETFRVADNLRDLTAWTVSTPNLRHVLYVDAGVNISPNVCILDRGHNLAGKQFYIGGWTDTTLAAVNTSIGPITMPSSPGGLPTDANGCLTSDGVWWKTFTPNASRVWGLQIEGMGAGLVPLLTGVHMGVSYRFTEYLNAPGAYDFRTSVKYMSNQFSRGGVRVKSRPINLDKLSISIDLDSADYAGFDAEIRRMLRYNVPMWFAFDDADATGVGQMRAFQFAGDFDYTPNVNPVHREIRTVEFEELIPTLYV